VAISAWAGDGIDAFLQVVGDRLRALATVTELSIPYDRGDVLAALYREGDVLSDRHDPDFIVVRARLAPDSVGRLHRMLERPGPQS
jgi:GTPase